MPSPSLYRLKGVIAIGAITLLESIAMLKGYNGVTLSASIAAIAGLGGWAVGRAGWIGRRTK
jgi:hypothetical protein